MAGFHILFLFTAIVRMVGCTTPKAFLPATETSYKLMEQLRFISGLSKLYIQNGNSPGSSGAQATHEQGEASSGQVSVRNEGKVKEYKDRLKEVLKNPDFSEYETMAENVYELITKVSDLRKLIVSTDEKVVGEIPKEISRSNVVILFSFLPSMYGSLTELATKIDEWKRMKFYADNSNMIPDIKAGSAGKWFLKQGFTEDELKKTPLDDLKTKLDEIVGSDKAVYKVLSAYATYYMSQKPTNLGERLSWLLMFAGSANNTEMEKNLKSHVNDKLAGKGDEFVRTVKALYEHDGPMMKLIGTGNGGDLYPVSRLHVKPGFFAEPVAAKYWEILADVCKHAETELKEIANMVVNKKPLVTKSDENIMTHLTAKGFNVENISVSGQTLADKIYDVVGNEKPLTKVCKIVEEYKIKSNPPTTNENISPTSSTKESVNGSVPSDNVNSTEEDVVQSEDLTKTKESGEESSQPTNLTTVKESGEKTSAFSTLNVFTLFVATIAMLT